MAKKGKLIIIEAGDGSGKETQTKALFERLTKDGKTVRKVSFPDYDSPSSALVKMYLGGEFGESADSVNPYAASTFYAVDRYASFKKDWQKDYENGSIILADRYTTSNMVHQAVKINEPQKRQEYLDWLYDLEFNRFGLPVPNKVIFLDMPPNIAAKLISDRAEKNKTKKDIHEKDDNYLSRCYDAYREVAEKYGWIKINCSFNGDIRTIDSISEDVYAAVKDIL